MAKHCVVARLCVGDTDTLSRQRDAILSRDRPDQACTHATDQAGCVCTRQTRQSAHDKANALRLDMHDKGISVATDFIQCKKKKNPPKIGASQFLCLFK